MHWLDILLLIILAGSALHGYRYGAVDQLLSLGALLGAVYLSRFAAPYVMTYIGVTQGFWPWVIAFLLLWLMLGVVRHVVGRMISVTLGLLDNIGGLLISLFVTLVVLALLFQGWEHLSLLYPVPQLPDQSFMKELLLDLGRTFWPDQLLIHRTPSVGEGVRTV